MSTRIFLLITNMISSMNSESCEENDYGLDLNLLTISY